jgi:hypothetical protein
MKIAVGFSTTNSLFAKAVRFFTNSTISHTYIRFYDKTLKTYLILHSDFGGTQFSLAERFDAENISMYEYIINNETLDKAIADNLWHLDKKYHYRKIWSWMWLIMLKRWVVRKIKDPIENPKKLICTDFVVFILNAAGVTDIEIGSMTPDDLHKWCEQNYQQRGWKKIVREDEPKTFLDYLKEFLTGD